MSHIGDLSPLPALEPTAQVGSILLKNSSLGDVAKRDSIGSARIDGGHDDGRALGIAGSVLLPI
jgi:hypothetical protein